MQTNNNTKNNKRKHVIVGTVIKVGKRTVGQVIGNEYVKDIETGHLLQFPPAIASDIQALHDAERAGAEYCVFTCTDTGIIYRAAISKIWDLGKRFNRGWGEQIYCMLNHWTQTRDPNITTTTTTAPDYADPTTADDEAVKPLNIKSRALRPSEIKFKKGKKTLKQLSMFGGRE
jgi:hypothetical protein